ncbi:hypothetical protein M1O16_01125 [Dehalococcoidia bacterium]|nr:hypothetical protein [Dehalococcoidia bacterium]
MKTTRTFPPPAAIKANAHVNSIEQYAQMWERAVKDPDGFWLEQAKSLTWFKEPTYIQLLLPFVPDAPGRRMAGCG